MAIRTLLLRLIILAAAALPTGGVHAQGKPNLTIALAANVNTLDPHKSATVGTDLSVISHLYTPLVTPPPSSGTSIACSIRRPRRASSRGSTRSRK